MINTKHRPVVLIILDGWGITTPGPGNAISLAKTPNIKTLQATYPHTKLTASGESVGLPHGEDGNSEVGHLNLGAGRIVYQDLPRINMAIADGSFAKNTAFLAAIKHVQDNQSALHILTLVGSGTVHASLNHLYALLWFLKNSNFTRPLFLHLFTDGRDSSPTSASNFIGEVEGYLHNLHIGKIASVIGRYYAMDRDNRWERTEKAYVALAEGGGETANSPEDAVSKASQRGETDEFIKPTVILENGKPIGCLNNNDAVIFANYRNDRTRQLVKAFVIPNFETMKTKKIIYDPYKDRYLKSLEEEPASSSTSTFKRNKIISNLFFVTMTEYEKDLPVEVAFPPEHVQFPLSAVISSFSLKQLHISETEKYAHVTFFFNGGREDPYPGEDRVHIPSPKVATYDLKPEMSANEITSVVLQRLRLNIYDFIVVNFANADMVGHTGKIAATMRSCEVVDDCLGKIVHAVLAQNGAVVITADHGNAEEMIDIETNGPETSHSTFPVPVIVVAKDYANHPIQLNQGILADIAPTILKLIGLPTSTEMTGRILI